MKARRLSTVVLLIAAIAPFLFLGCVKEPTASAPTKGASPTDMLREYPVAYDKLWKIVTDAIQYEYLIRLKVADPASGFFTSEFVVDETPQGMLRYRISGKLTPVKGGTSLQLYNQRQALVENTYRALATDLVLENKIFRSVEKQLNR